MSSDNSDEVASHKAIDPDPKAVAKPTGAAAGLIDYLRLAVDLTRAIAWPVLVLAAVVTFREPVRDVLNVLPQKLSEAGRLSVGSFALEVQAQTRAQGNPELATILTGLSREAIQRLMSVPEKTHFLIAYEYASIGEYTLFTDKDLDALNELATKGLVQLDEPLPTFRAWVMTRFRKTDQGNSYKPIAPLSATERSRMIGQGFALTTLGSQAIRAIVNAVVQEIRATDTSQNVVK
jgi:hypothetical protein